MKKILLVAVLVLLPLSAFADLKTMDAEALDEITAQEGVKITIGGLSDAGTSIDWDGAGGEDPISYCDKAMKIRKSNASSAWQNGDVGEDSAGAIVMQEANVQDIFVQGEISILAATDAVDGSYVKIQIGKEASGSDAADELDIVQTAKATKIYIQNQALVDNTIKGVDDAHCLGTNYAAGGLTSVLGHIKISALP